MLFFSTFSLFQQARLKLTLWYLLIILIVSIFFSLGIYRLTTAEFDRLQDMQQRRLEFRMRDPYVVQLPPDIQDQLRQRLSEDEIIIEARQRIQMILLLINLGILTFSAVIGYFLAGKTLQPIRAMVDEQNRFITDASHELKTPLTALRSEMEVTLRDKKLTTKDAKEIIESNLEEVISIQSLTENLLKLTKSFNQHQKSITDVSLKKVAEEAIKKVAPLARKKLIEIKKTEGDVLLESNTQELTELLVVFLDNAIKYSPEKTTIKLDYKKIDGNVQIKITDQGQGIDKKELPLLFDRFYRAEKSRSKNDASGFGLGLSIAKRIIENYQGHIKVESELEKGSTFIITLPIKYKFAKTNRLTPFS